MKTINMEYNGYKQTAEIMDNGEWEMGQCYDPDGNEIGSYSTPDDVRGIFAMRVAQAAENHIISQAAAALGSIKSPRKAASSRENGKIGRADQAAQTGTIEPVKTKILIPPRHSNVRGIGGIMEKILYVGRISSEGIHREVRLRADGPCLKAGSRTRYLHQYCDGGDDTPWQESFVSDDLLLALSKREGKYLDIRSEEGRKLRRRVEDALRKSEDSNVLLTVATLLGVRREAPQRIEFKKLLKRCL